MTVHGDDASFEADDAETRISHFIPAVRLQGSRATKLETLDTLISYLERLRQELIGNATGVRVRHETHSPLASRPGWPWFAAGVVASALFLLLMLAARGCA